MEYVKNLIGLLSERLKTVAASNAVVAKPVSVGDRHVVPLCELGLTFAGGGGATKLVATLFNDLSILQLSGGYTHR